VSVVERLASARGERTQGANVRVAEACLADPAALAEVAAALGGKDARLVGDCAEVMTKVGEARAELLVPHAPALLDLLLGHRNGRVRWESAHALALVAGQVPALIAKALPRLTRIVRDDPGLIVRDYVLDAIAAWGATGGRAAGAAMPVLAEALDAWNGKHAARILRGLGPIAAAAPRFAPAIREHAARFADHARPGVRKAARALAAGLGDDGGGASSGRRRATPGSRASSGGTRRAGRRARRRSARRGCTPRGSRRPRG